MEQKNTTHKLVVTALLTALTCVATMLIKIPSPFKGYIHIGDCIVLVAGWLLSPFYGFLSAGLGSALADVFSGYVAYVPITFFVKGTMALIAYYGVKVLHKTTSTLSQIISGIVAEIWMVVGYFVFEGFLYGFAPSVANLLPNGIQGVAGLILGCIVIKVFEKSKIHFR